MHLVHIDALLCLWRRSYQDRTSGARAVGSIHVVNRSAAKESGFLIEVFNEQSSCLYGGPMREHGFSVVVGECDGGFADDRQGYCGVSNRWPGVAGRCWRGFRRCGVCRWMGADDATRRDGGQYHRRNASVAPTAAV